MKEAKAHYDAEYDILHINITENPQSYGTEETIKATVFRDIETDEVTGIMIMDFCNKSVWQAHNNSAHIPNAETVAAMKEADEIIKNAKNGLIKSNSLNDLFNEVDGMVADRRKEFGE